MDEKYTDPMAQTMAVSKSAVEDTDPAVETPWLQPGTRVDNFKVVRMLGRGGMGAVYLSRDTQLGRLAALKMILPDGLGDEQAVKQFKQEAQITARFNHPNIVTIYSVGEYEGSLYIALEYLQGQNLEERLAEERPGQKEAIRLGLAVAEAVSEAHRHGVLHRDLKPSNILVPRDGRVRVLDFGLSRALPASGNTLVNITGREKEFDVGSGNDDVLEIAEKGLRGTPAYMAPEQWMEKPATEAADIWALGLILYQLVTGRHPYEGKNLYGLCMSVSDSKPVPSVNNIATGTPIELVKLIDECLDKKPENRPNAAEVVETLSSLLHGTRQSAGVVEHNPFRGLLPFSERHSHRFFGRDSEIAFFMERLREEPLLPVVGPSGAGKSSFVHAGIIPRLREHSPLTVLKMRPGRHPFETLVSRMMTGETIDKDRLTVIETDINSASLSKLDHNTQADQGLKMLASVLVPTSDVKDNKKDQTVSGSIGNGTAETGGCVSSMDDGETIESFALKLMETPTRLSLLLSRLVDRYKTRVLLFVDQLEEVFTMTTSEKARLAFLEAICTAADDPESGVLVVFTMRDDFLGRLATVKGAREALSRVQVIGTPSRDSLFEILRKPVEETGYRYEDEEMVSEMVEEVEGEPAALPLLQFTGQILWEKRDRKKRTLTRKAYIEAGGVAGALAKQADGLLEGMPPDHERAARIILLRLVTPEGTRQVISRSELVDGLGNEGYAVLDRLIAARTVLVRKGPSEAQLELVHESLIKQWARLSRWLDESREERGFLTEVGQAAALWEKRGKPKEEVWQGEALKDALRKASHCAHLPTNVSSFLEFGKKLEIGRTRRKRALIFAAAGILAAVAAGSLAMSWALSNKEKRAQLNEQEAQRQRQRALIKQAEAQREGARADLVRNAMVEARAKLRASLEILDSVEARALWRQMQKMPLYMQKQLGGVVYAAAFSPAGDKVALACQDHVVYVFDAVTGLMQHLRGHTDQVFRIAFSPRGDWLASAGRDGKIRLWRIGEDGAHVQRVLQKVEGAIIGVSFSPDGKTLASGGEDRTVRFWDVDSGEIRMALEGHKDEIRSVRFSPDGRVLASAGRDAEIRLWKPDSGEEITKLTGHKGMVTDLDFHPSGKMLVSASIDGTARLWHVREETSAAAEVLRGYPRGVTSVRFRPDGQVLAMGNRDGGLQLWDWEKRRLVQKLAGHEMAIGSIDYSPDGSLLSTASYDRTAKLWRPTPEVAATVSAGHEGLLVGADFDPAARLVATAGEDREIRIWRVETGETVQILRGHESAVYDVKFSPDGKLLASGGTDETVRLWNSDDGWSPVIMRGHSGAVSSVGFNADGALLASGGYDNKVYVWDVKSRKQVGVLSGHSGPVRSVVFHPSKTNMLATAGMDGAIRIWDLVNQKELKVLSNGGGWIMGIAFCPEGKRLVSGGADQTVRAWDLDKGSQEILGRANGRVYSVAFHPEGKIVGSAGADGVMRLWDISSGGVRALHGHRGEANYVSFSPDGKKVATTGDDGTLRIFHVDSGRPAWRAPLISAKPKVLFTHQGRIPLNEEKSVDVELKAWEIAVQDRASRAAMSPDGSLLCISDYAGRLEIWEPVEDRMLAKPHEPGLEEVLAFPFGCVTFSKERDSGAGTSTRSGRVKIYDKKGAFKILEENAVAVAQDLKQGRILISTDREIHVYNEKGTRENAYPASTGVTTAALISEWLVVGFRDGNIELFPTEPGHEKPLFEFENVGPSEVTRLMDGPEGTVIAGFADGGVGLWSLANGARLEHGRLHGPVLHLLPDGRTLHGASELGTRLKWDLEGYYMGYCELMNSVWQEIPYTWGEGVPRISPRPADHPCAVK